MTHTTATRVARPFRFGVVAPILSDMATWRDQVRRITDSGYSTLLMPDVPSWQPAPAPVLAIAAEISSLQVGTWVYASPLRSARMTALEAHSLTVLTEGRFEFGIGTGRPGIEDEVAELGLPAVDPARRLDRIRKAVEQLRELDGPEVRTPVAMAVRGPRARALAAEMADTVSIANTPDDHRTDIIDLAREFRTGRDIELALHISVVGDTVAPFMAGPDTDPAAMRAAGSLAVLPDDTAEAVEQIQQLREEVGFSYIVIGSNSARTLAPVVAELAGQ